MNAEGEYLAQSVANQHNVVEASWRETYQNKTTQTEVPINGQTAPNEVLFVLPIGLVTILIVTFVGIVLKQLKSLKTFNEPFITHQYSHQVSCRRCRFFNNNFYLKCAVHPDTVLTSEAKDCPDYSPQHQKDFFHR
jgi:hypothetical protein